MIEEWRVVFVGFLRVFASFFCVDCLLVAENKINIYFKFILSNMVIVKDSYYIDKCHNNKKYYYYYYSNLPNSIQFYPILSNSIFNTRPWEGEHARTLEWRRLFDT
jgi:hypothetical protein